MGRKDGRIEPGQSLNSAISASAWNRMMDAADIVHGERYGVAAGTTSAGHKVYTWAYCRVSPAVDQWGIVAITGVDVAPTVTESDDATQTFLYTPVLSGGTPSTSTTTWGVAVEPIANGEIGRVAIAGIVQAKVEIKHASDAYVSCKSSAAELRSGSAGEGQILWKESGTGAGKWALVRLGHVRGIVRGTFTAPWAKDATATVTDAIASGVTYSAKNYFASLTGSGTKRCAIAYTGGEWILIAAEC